MKIIWFKSFKSNLLFSVAGVSLGEDAIHGCYGGGRVDAKKSSFGCKSKMSQKLARFGYLLFVVGWFFVILKDSAWLDSFFKTSPLEYIGADQAHQENLTGKGVVVAVIDELKSRQLFKKKDGHPELVSGSTT
jgi:hypothetical protein